MPVLLFDNDGTLIESEQLCCQTIAEIYRDEKSINLDAFHLFKHYRGWELAKILDAIELQTGAPWDEAFVERYRERMLNNFETQLQAIPDVKPALDQLPFPKAVVSNGPLKKMQDSLRITGLAPYFGDKLLSAYDINIWKPDPGIYLHAAKLLDAAPSECIVIEDSPTGVEAGVRAGMRVLFYNTHQDPCEFDEVYQFQSMKELPRLVNQIK